MRWRRPYQKAKFGLWKGSRTTSSRRLWRPFSWNSSAPDDPGYRISAPDGDTTYQREPKALTPLPVASPAFLMEIYRMSWRIALVTMIVCAQRMWGPASSRPVVRTSFERMSVLLLGMWVVIWSRSRTTSTRAARTERHRGRAPGPPRDRVVCGRRQRSG